MLSSWQRYGSATILLVICLSASPCFAQKPQASTPKPAVFPEPTQFEPKPQSIRQDDDALTVAYSPDGALLASGGADGVTRLWDPVTTKLLHKFAGHRDAVAAVAFSRDGLRLATASYDKTVKVWDVVARKEICTLSGHTNAVLAVAFHPNGKQLISGSADRLVKRWDIDAKKEINSYAEHKGAIRGVAVSPDGNLLASAGSDRHVVLWNLGNWTSAGVLRGHSGPVRAVVFSPDGKLLASASEDKTISLWDVATRKEKHSLEGHAEAVSAIAFSPRGQLLASTGADKSFACGKPQRGASWPPWRRGILRRFKGSLLLHRAGKSPRPQRTSRWACGQPLCRACSPAAPSPTGLAKPVSLPSHLTERFWLPSATKTKLCWSIANPVRPSAACAATARPSCTWHSVPTVRDW